jgi:hypothetical protein
MKKALVTSLAVVAFAAFGSFASAQLISGWTFETSQPTTAGPFANELGPTTGQALGVHVSTATVYSSPAGNGSAHSFSANTWGSGDYWQFSLNTTGFSNIFVTYGQTGSNTGPRDFVFQYSIDGTNFTSLSPYTITNDSWSSGGSPKTISEKTWDLSAITALNNAGTVVFRVVDNSTTAITGGTVATTGTSRIDDFYVSSGAPIFPVPEPATWMLMGAGLLIGAQQWRRRKG